MSFPLPAEAPSAAELVEFLADPHRYVAAYQRLIGRHDLPAESGPAVFC